MSKWHTVDVLPHRPMAIELFHKNMVLHEPDPVRDYRRQLGYWDGKFFYEMSTGHNAFACFHGRQDWLPTHWRALPKVPQ